MQEKCHLCEAVGGSKHLHEGWGPKPQAKVYIFFCPEFNAKYILKMEKHWHLYIFIWYFCRQDRNLRVVLRTFD